MKKVLSVDGGGIRGILPSALLADLESRLGPAGSQFDLIAGTSTGGIIACGLCAGVKASALLDLYTKEGHEVFDPNFGAVLLDPKYNAGKLEAALQRELGAKKLSEATPELLVTSYCVNAKDPVSTSPPVYAGSWFFKSRKAKADPTQDLPLWQIARATSAAPTYFPTAELPLGWFVDGGVFANNPAMCALAEARNAWPGEEIRLLSIGTGVKSDALNGHDSQGWGVIQWATRIVPVLMDGSADAASYQCEAILGSAFLRCDVPLSGVNDAFDDTSAANIAGLSNLGNGMVAKFGKLAEDFLA